MCPSRCYHGVIDVIIIIMFFSLYTCCRLRIHPAFFFIYPHLTSLFPVFIFRFLQATLNVIGFDRKKAFVGFNARHM